jgi:hypothetical protein
MPSPFDEFLSWLAPDRDEAALKYEELRKKLVGFFIWRGCHIPDELADESIDRASTKIAEGKVDRSVDPKHYCFGVAKNVLHEYKKRPHLDPLEIDPPSVAPVLIWPEPMLACLDKCLARLREHDRELVTRWHQCGKGREKIEVHKQMAEAEGGMNMLRLRIFRTKNALRDCVIACLRRDTGNLLQ